MCERKIDRERPGDISKFNDDPYIFFKCEIRMWLVLAAIHGCRSLSQIVDLMAVSPRNVRFALLFI